METKNVGKVFQANIFYKKQFKLDFNRFNVLINKDIERKLSTQKYFPCRYNNKLPVTLPDMRPQFH